MKERMNLQKHLENAQDLAIAGHHLTKIFNRCQEHFNKSGSLMRLLYKICPGNWNGIFTKIRSELDHEYHMVATNEDFKKHGHVYYDLAKRYEENNS